MMTTVTSTAPSALPDLKNGLFSTSLISGDPVMNRAKINNKLQPNSPLHSPIVNKFLSLGKPDLNESSESSSSSVCSSPSSDSPVKLRDLPHTTTLCGCVAFVDVWSSDGRDNRSCVFRNFLTRMGATVCKKFTKEYDITHVVFKDGHKSVLQKAQKRNIKIVTCLWVDRCRVLQRWLNEEDYLFNPTSYKPPKKFCEMQPQDPEEAMRRSAERLKRRKARYAKKQARIMFQSPLVTHNYTGTPKDEGTPTHPLDKKREKILVADTPYHPPSPLILFNPSIVFETPMSDSMKRKVQRLKEGKPVFSPPSSDDEGGDDSCPPSPARPSDTSPTLPNGNREEDNPPDRTKFSPIAETQCFVKKSWRASGISPPKFDVSVDEIPETQPMDHLGGAIEPLPIALELQERLSTHIMHDMHSNNTLHLNEDMEMTTMSHGSRPIPDGNTEKQNETDLHSDPMSLTQIESPHSSLKLHVSGDSTHSSGTSTFLEVDIKPTPPEAVESHEDTTPVDHKITKPTKPSTKRKMRRLLADDEYTEPVSLLVSPKSSADAQTSKCESQADDTTQSSLPLPQLGLSSYKSLAQSGRFFQRLYSTTPSECSAVSGQLSPCQHRILSSQSTDYDHMEPGSNSEDQRRRDGELLATNDSLCLYDRVKMRKKRISTEQTKENILSTQPPNSAKKRKRRRSGKSNESNSPPEVASTEPNAKMPKISEEKMNPNLFCSQAARTILENMKKRRSTMEFTTPMVTDVEVGRKSQKNRKKRKPVIVLTNLHSDERFEVHQAVRKLSNFRISSTVRDHTTHVVCGAARRTMNVLRAIARGVWLLSKNWVTDSQSAGFWLEEDSYEMPTLFPAAQKNRRSKVRCSTWKNIIFENINGHIYIADDTKPPQDELKELISLCGGSVVGSPRRASLCIGNPGRVIAMMPVVHETWVIDCVCENRLLSYDQYLIDP